MPGRKSKLLRSTDSGLVEHADRCCHGNRICLVSRIAELEEKFYTCVTVDELVKSLSYEADLVSYVYEYWKVKRKSNFGRPLMAPKGIRYSISSFLSPFSPHLAILFHPPHSLSLPPPHSLPPSLPIPFSLPKFLFI